MATWFDESRLDDEAALATADLRLRELAESGARVRREAAEAAAGVAAAVAAARDAARPRAIIAAGPDSRLLRAVLEPWCPVPFVAWPGSALPGWAGGLDLVVVLAPDGSDRATAAAVAEAVRRGCQVVVASPDGLTGGPARRGPVVDDRADGHPRPAGHRGRRAGVPRPGRSRTAGGPRATSRRRSTTWPSPARRTATSPSTPAKMLAIALADTNPVVWGGSSLAARAARRVSETIRRASGRSAIAGDAEHLLPLIEAARPRDVFDDPFADGAAGRQARCCWSSTTAPTTRSSARTASGSRRRPRARRTRGDGDHGGSDRGRPLRVAGAQREVRRGVPPPRARRRLIAGGVLSARDRGTTGGAAMSRRRTWSVFGVAVVLLGAAAVWGLLMLRA